MTMSKRLAPIMLASWVVLAACGGPQTTTTAPTTAPIEVTETTLIRFVNAVPDSPSVDAWVADRVVASGAGYQQWGDWTEVPAGEWDVVLRHGEAVELTDTYNFQPDQHYWIFAYGMMTPVGAELEASFLIAPEEELEITADDTWIRFANLAADGEAYGLVITTGGGFRGVFPNQALGSISEYKLGPIQENTFDVIPARDTSLPAVVSFERNMQVGILYTFIVAGRAGNDSLEVFHVAEGAVR